MATLTEREEALVDCLKTLIEFFVHVPVYNEIGLPKEVAGRRTRIDFTYPRWNMDYPVRVWINDKQAELTKDVDFLIPLDDCGDGEGRISLITGAGSGSTFAVDGATGGQLPTGWQVEINYSFRYFTDIELVRFLELGLVAVNMRRPATGFASLGAMPAEFEAAVILFAYYRALERVLIDANFWNQHLIWADKNYLSNVLMGRVTAAEARFDKEADMAKPRSFVKPRGVHSGRFSTQQRVTSSNFQNFVIGGGF